MLFRSVSQSRYGGLTEIEALAKSVIPSYRMDLDNLARDKNPNNQPSTGSAMIYESRKFIEALESTKAMLLNKIEGKERLLSSGSLKSITNAAGLGAYWIALFHLMTHAFFKSLLFLGAGNVMHAMHDELNIKKMGGLYGSMKATAILMSVASVALAGIYPFAGLS